MEPFSFQVLGNAYSCLGNQRRKRGVCVGSVKELFELCEVSVEAGFMNKNPLKGFVIGDMSDQNYNSIDLHKHVVDKIILCSNSGKKMFREPDLIDVWFDSGAMPFAQFHYPFENKSVIDNRVGFPLILLRKE